MMHQLARSKLQIPCPQCFEILKPIDSQRFMCDNPKCHLLEVTAIVSYSEEKCETVYQYKRKEWVEGKKKSDYILLDRQQLENGIAFTESLLRTKSYAAGDSGKHFHSGRLTVLKELVDDKRLKDVESEGRAKQKGEE